MNKLFTRFLTVFFTLFCCIFLQESCIPTERIDPNAPPKDTTTNNPISEVAKWDLLSNVSAEQVIRAIHVTPFELLILSNNQFFRLDSALALKEIRILSTDRQLYGAPIFSDNNFMRLSQAVNNRQVIELHLTRNREVVKRINTDELVDTSKKQSFVIDAFGRTPGAFSTDGTKLLVVGVLYPDFQPYAMILDVNLNFQADNFTSVALKKSVKIPNLSTDNKIEACRFIKNSFFLATKDGGFRISTEGVVTRLFNHWTLDFFERGGKIYATAFNGGDFSVSNDNGSTWQKVAGGSELRYVEVVNGLAFSQVQRGQPYGVGDSTLARVKALKYNASFPNKPDLYNDVKYFKKKYFFNAGDKGNQILWTEKIVTQ